MRILLDYRPALKQRTGVGEFVHELARALARTGADDISVLTTSWKDRPGADLTARLAPARIVDRRIPVRGLTWAWNRVGWPPVEWLAGRTDVVHSQTPLVIPASNAAQVVTIHDLDFLLHPDRAEAEMRRDFPARVRAHAHRADHVVVSSHYAAGEVRSRLGVPNEKVSVCSPGAPDWAADIALARKAQERHGDGDGGPRGAVLFMGTVEPRKNIAGLLDAYALLRSRRSDAPPLVMAGGVRPSVEAVLAQARRPPLAGHVTLLGYVSDEQRRQLYRDARMLVLPSLEEGFGLPVLEAMACGVPVVISNRGSLPEVAADAALPVDPLDANAIARELERLLDPMAAADASARGLVRARDFSWNRAATAAREAYQAAVGNRARRGR